MKPKNMIPVKLIIAGFCALVTSSGLHAQDLNWTNALGDNEFSENANWDGDLAEGATPWIGLAGDDKAILTEDFYEFNRMHVGQSGSAGALEINSGGFRTAASNITMSVGRDGGNGLVNQYGGNVVLDGSVELGTNGDGTGTYNLNGGEMRFTNHQAPDFDSTKRISLEIGTGGGTGTFVVAGGHFISRAGVHVGSGGSFRVSGSESPTVSVGAEDSVDGFWYQEDGGVLEVGIDSDGLSRIHVVDVGGPTENNADVHFLEGALLDVSFLDGSDRGGAWDVMSWDGKLTDEGLGFAPGVDESIWSFDFIDTNDSGEPDMLRITAEGEEPPPPAPQVVLFSDTFDAEEATGLDGRTADTGQVWNAATRWNLDGDGRVTFDGGQTTAALFPTGRLSSAYTYTLTARISNDGAGNSNHWMTVGFTAGFDGAPVEENGNFNNAGIDGRATMLFRANGEINAFDGPQNSGRLSGALTGWPVGEMLDFRITVDGETLETTYEVKEVDSPAYTLLGTGTLGGSLEDVSGAGFTTSGGLPAASVESIELTRSLNTPAVWPVMADFGSTRYFSILEAITLADYELGPAEKGGTFYIDESFTIESLPGELSGKPALKTRNRLTTEFPEMAVAFKGPNEEVYVPHEDELNLLGDWTIEFMINLREESNDFVRFIRKTDDGNFGLNVFLDNPDFSAGIGDNIWLRVENSTYHRRATPRLPLREWQHVAITWDTFEDETRYYLNGELENIETGLVEMDSENFNPLRLGQGVGAANNPDGFANHALAEIRFWDHVRSDSQIASHRGDPLADPGQEAGLVGYWPMNEGSGDLARDLSGNENQGTLLGAKWLPSAPVGNLLSNIGFMVSQPTTVYVVFDGQAVVPQWLEDRYNLTGMNVETTAGNFGVWERHLTAREHVVLPFDNQVWTPEDNNYWVILGEGAGLFVDDGATSAEQVFETDSMNSEDWFLDTHHWTLNTGPGVDPHTPTLLIDVLASTELQELDPEVGFELSANVRIPRFQDPGEDALGIIALGDSEDVSSSIRGEWLPYAADGSSSLRLVNSGTGDVLAEEIWAGLTPKPADNDIGVAGGDGEAVMQAGSPVFVGEPTVHFEEDFAGGGADWTSGSFSDTADQWEIGQPNGGPGAAFSGQNVAATGLDGGYDLESASWLRSPVIDLTEASDTVTLSYQEFLDVDPWVGPDTGTLFHRATVSVIDADTGVTRAELAHYNDHVGEWTLRELDVSMFAGRRIVLEFGFFSDDVMEDDFEGWFLDDVRVTERGLVIAGLPPELTIDGALNGYPTDGEGVSDTSDTHVQFTLEDRSGNTDQRGTVFVAWDTRAGGMEPDWLRDHFSRTDHFVDLNPVGQHRLWYREYADGEIVTLGGASAVGAGVFPDGVNNYFVLFGDARTGMEELYMLKSEGSAESGVWDFKFTLVDAQGHSQTVSALIEADFEGRSSFGLFASQPGGAVAPNPDGGEEGEINPLIWQIFSVYLGDRGIDVGLQNFASWRAEHFPGQLDNLEVSGPGAAPAGDGVVNLIKYAFGLDPWTAVTSSDLPGLKPDGDDILVVDYWKRTDIDDIEYIPQVSEDLVNWESGEPFVVEIPGEIDDEKKIQEFEAIGVLPEEAPRGFLRLKVKQKD